LILEWTGLAPEEVLGVGDTQADEAWLREVGWRAAPANGREALPGMHYYSSREVAKGLLDIFERLRACDYERL
jgi:hydroxymethylpyrimidine pyrophosphatase-like HAD family hydrolase